MKLLSAILLMFIILFASCDGKERARYTHKEKLEQSKLSESFFEQETYFPENYSEVVTDTIFSNGYHIKLKVYSDMNTSVLKEFKKDTINYKHHFRNFKGELIVNLNGKEILNRTLDKSQFSNKKNDAFWQQAILGNIVLDNENSNDNEVLLHAFYRIPKSNQYKDFKIIVTSQGFMKIEELTAHIL